ncbi:hypothetical protein ABW19_dt0210226 [Dactylella cylindrospora]|nr:hypothetical protein ABW19_dt0210226 [Dactylella cylindrospora]
MVVVINPKANEVSGPLRTPFTELFGIKHPISLAGMNIAAGPRLCAAVIEAGGFGCMGGNGYYKAPEYEKYPVDEFLLEFFAHQTPERVRKQIHEMKDKLVDPDNAAFGVDILLPQVGGSARKTNYDYTEGTAEAIVDVIIDEKAKLFISGLGSPPKHLVDKLHKAGIVVGAMIGHPKHVERVLDAGCDLLVAQGWEAGGHTGDIATMVLTPMVVEMCKNRRSAFTGRPIIVLAAGGIHNSKGLAAALMMGADGVWCGTRFVAAEESGASNGHQKAVLDTDVTSTVRTSVYTGRPMRVQRNTYNDTWEKNPASIDALTEKGIVPVIRDARELRKAGKKFPKEMEGGIRPMLLGQVSGAINEIQPARKIIDEMVYGCVEMFKRGDRIRSKL